MSVLAVVQAPLQHRHTRNLHSTRDDRVLGRGKVRINRERFTGFRPPFFKPCDQRAIAPGIHFALLTKYL